MSNPNSLHKEFEREAKTTRKHLERLPTDKFGWKPHQKSYTAGELASHIVDCVRWADSIVNLDEVDIDPATYKAFSASSVEELLQSFDADVAVCKQLLESADDEAFARPWKLKLQGRLMFERQRGEVVRDFLLSHLIHHRGQLSVYLRLLDVPVPATYGPSADEQ